MHRWSHTLFRLPGQTPVRCKKAAEKLLSPKGSLSVDKRTNRLLVRDSQTVVESLQRWAEQMDLPRRAGGAFGAYCDH